MILSPHLMLLPLPPLLLKLLLFLQLLGDPSLSYRLLLQSLVGLEVERRLQRGRTTTARDDFGSKLLLEVE